MSPLERVQLLLINFPALLVLRTPPLPLAPAVIYLHSVFTLTRLFLCFPLPPLPRSPSLLSPAAVHASRRWDIAFLILLTGANIYVLFFDIHCSCSHRTPALARTEKARQENKHMSSSPPDPPPSPFPFPTKKNPIVSMIIIFIIFLCRGANKGKEVRWTLPCEVKV